MPATLWFPSGINTSDAEWYRDIAWSTVVDQSDLWNNPIPQDPVEVQISASGDDAHKVYLQPAVFNGILFGFAPLKNVGLRFQNVEIPAGAEILEARIEGSVFTGGQSQYPITVKSEVLLRQTGALFSWPGWWYSNQPNGDGHNDSVFVTPWAPGTFETVADITSGLASLVARPEWFDGDSVTISILTRIPNAGVLVSFEALSEIHSYWQYSLPVP